jgi:ABC-type multidrug transport system fused ATPase/permease subunit
MNEIIQGIHTIKMYTWEQSFAKVINKIRSKEVEGIRGTLYLRALIISLDVVSKFSVFISLVTYLYYDNVFTASKVFIVTSYFYYIYTSMLQFWSLAISDVACGFVSIRRIQEFLLQNEAKISPKINDEIKIDENDEKSAQEKLLMESIPSTNSTLPKRIINSNLENKGIFFKDASTSWTSEGSEGYNLCLENLQFQKGVNAIVGQVGMGKSTILQIILGELELDKGEIEINGSISYASQEPWVFEATVKRNIIFSEDFNEQRYNEVIKACALEKDFELFPEGDETVVGEKGVSLSGGQRARIDLARCLYKEADIYLLDDPLSAVDIRVGKHIFEQSIKGFLRVKKINIC